MASKKRPERLISGRVDIAHARYRIIAGERKEGCQAVAYVGKRKVHAATGESVKAAVDTLASTLDEHLARLRRARVDGVPNEHEFREALAALEPNLPDGTLELVLVHSRLSGSMASMGELARCMNRDEEAVTATYMQLGRKLGRLLDFSPEPDESEPDLAPVLTFAFVKARPDRASARLRLRPEMAAAVAKMDRKSEAFLLQPLES